MRSTSGFQVLRQPGRQLRHISEQRQRPYQGNDKWADFLDDQAQVGFGDRASHKHQNTDRWGDLSNHQIHQQHDAKVKQDDVNESQGNRDVK